MPGPTVRRQAPHRPRLSGGLGCGSNRPIEPLHGRWSADQAGACAMDEKAVRGILWTMLPFGATKVIGVLTTIALARMLAPTDFGLFALATLGTGLLSIFNGNWLGATLIVKQD